MSLLIFGGCLSGFSLQDAARQNQRLRSFTRYFEIVLRVSLLNQVETFQFDYKLLFLFQQSPVLDLCHLHSILFIVQRPCTADNCRQGMSLRDPHTLTEQNDVCWYFIFILFSFVSFGKQTHTKKTKNNKKQQIR